MSIYLQTFERRKRQKRKRNKNIAHKDEVPRLSETPRSPTTSSKLTFNGWYKHTLFGTHTFYGYLGQDPSRSSGNFLGIEQWLCSRLRFKWSAPLMLCRFLEIIMTCPHQPNSNTHFESSTEIQFSPNVLRSKKPPRKRAIKMMTGLGAGEFEESEVPSSPVGKWMSFRSVSIYDSGMAGYVL